MSESLRNDGRVWVPKQQGDKRPPNEIPEAERDYYLERRYPAFGNLVPRDIASRAAKGECDDGKGVGNTGFAVYLDFADAIKRLGRDVVADRYGNLFQMYEEITGENPYETPMRIYPAPHYTMGGLWVDYNLMSTIPGLFVLGEANFSDHGANRLGASALMQGLADGYFVVPRVVGELPGRRRAGSRRRSTTDHGVQASRGRACARLRQAAGGATASGRCATSTGSSGASCGTRSAWAAPGGPEEGHREDSRAARGVLAGRRRCRAVRRSQQAARDGRPRGRLPRARRADGPRRADARGIVRRPLPRGAPDPEGEAKRDDEDFTLRRGLGVQRRRRRSPSLHKEPLEFENMKPSRRSYK